MSKYVCIHAHFYQPPRENAWRGIIERQESAAPYHDWNERINEECYAPNARAKILNGSNQIRDIVNNYRQISFNFGPTLLSWMKKAAPVTYSRILEADRQSFSENGGHGNALAQGYHHSIMPLANTRDKETEVLWGIRDFEYRFGRKPEGMWLAETAIDVESLEILAAQGISFTILAPWQAAQFRKIGTEEWQDVENGSPDIRRPYLCKLPSGKQIVLFFYDAGIARGVAFEGLLFDGEKFAHRLMDTFDDNDTPQIFNFATDGESYGHHHRFGEMALAYCIEKIEASEKVKLINYGYYLEKFPPEYEVKIHENTSWSCAHGIERWRSDCGCRTGGEDHWNQSWREPLRRMLNWLRDELIGIYEAFTTPKIKDIWLCRNEYIDLILSPSDRNKERFFSRHTINEMSDRECNKLFNLLEMQRFSLRMFTSCGWFFNEVSGIETQQILQYAFRAISLAKEVSGIDLYDQFIERMSTIPSNKYTNASEIYQRY